MPRQKPSGHFFVLASSSSLVVVFALAEQFAALESLDLVVGAGEPEVVVRQTSHLIGDEAPGRVAPLMVGPESRRQG